MAEKIPLTQEFLDSVSKHYANGLGQRKIAHILKCSRRLVKNAYKLLDLNPSEKLNRPIPTEKTCIDCKKLKSIDQFPERARGTLADGTKSSRIAYETRCHDCFKVYHNERAKENRKDRKVEYTPKPKLSEEFLNEVKTLIDDGFNKKEIVKKFGCKKSRMERAFKILKEKYPDLQIIKAPREVHKKAIPQYLIDETRKLFDDGLGQRAIAAKLKCTRDLVKTIYDILGIDASKRTNPRKQIPSEKVCCRCKINKPIDQFRQRINSDRISYEASCKDCDREYNNEKALEKYHTKKNDIYFKLRRHVSFCVWRALFSNGSTKDGKSCIDFLPFALEELKAYLESKFEDWMTWDNHGVYNNKTWDDADPTTWTWQIDHIIPQSCLPYTSMNDENFKKCWALSNLRPYSAKQNILDNQRNMSNIIA